MGLVYSGLIFIYFGFVCGQVKRNIYLILCLQDDLEAELLDTPEREPVSSSSSGKPRRNFGTCNAESGGGAGSQPQLNLLE